MTPLKFDAFDEWLPWLAEIAEARGLSRQGAIREAIWEYLQAHRGEVE